MLKSVGAFSLRYSANLEVNGGERLRNTYKRLTEDLRFLEHRLVDGME